MGAFRMCLVMVCVVLLTGTAASAQYFGGNKVRYRPLDFKVMTTEHFDVYFHLDERQAADVAARLAERWNARLERLFGTELSSRQPLVLYASHVDFEQTNVVASYLSEGVGGVTEPHRRRIALPLAGPLADTDHVIGHELVHAYQFDLARLFGGSLARLPLWFVEGMAEYVSLGATDAHTAMKVRDAVVRNALPSLADLDTGAYFPYQWGHAVFAYIASRYGELALPRLLRAALLSGSVSHAIQSELEIAPQQLSHDWHTAVRDLYAPVLSASSVLPAGARLAVRETRFKDTLNIAPALSPDGRWVAFLSTRDLHSIDLYVADADSGRVVKRLTRTATDSHYSSLQFINSAGSWNASSTHLAIGTIVSGRATLTIFDVWGRKRQRDVTITDVDEVLNPSWAPDSHAIAFTGMRQGLTDLYVYDLATGGIRPLTADAYADIHPAWAPDSRRVAFATDRFSSDLDTVRIGGLQLAVVDSATRAVERLPGFDRGKHINPQWSPDGRSLHFIATPDGVPNLFRVSLSDGQVTQVTSMSVGMSGLTASSPAFSVSAGRFVFSTYDAERYRLYVWSPSEPAGVVAPMTVNAAALAPAGSPDQWRRMLVERHDSETTPPQGYPAVPYTPRLSLAEAEQQMVGFGISSFGPVLGGGASFSFSDMLGDRLLTAAAGAGPLGAARLNEIAYGAAYVRLDSRWQWSLMGAQIPHVMAATFERAPAIGAGGEPLGIDRQTTYSETERHASGVLMYPFDRRKRVELSGGLLHSVYERTDRTVLYSPLTGERRAQSSETRPFGGSLRLVRSGIAFVSDTATFGPVGPIYGERSRLELTPTFGSVRFTGVLVDYRRYFMPARMYTVAVRALHYGRYGPDGDDARLHPAYIADPALVRGYDVLDAVASTCPVAPTGHCAALDRLGGSRLLVGNLELRVPLLRMLGVQQMYGPLPVELAPFLDGGVAWRRGNGPFPSGAAYPGISSAGLAVRVAFGFAVAEIHVVHPFDREAGGRTLGVALLPAW